MLRKPVSNQIFSSFCLTDIYCSKWSCSIVSNSATTWTVAYAPTSMGFSRQEYWSGLPFPSPGDLPNPGDLPDSGRSTYHEKTFFHYTGGSDSKESFCNVGDLGLTPGLGRSPGGGLGNPLQYSCLENPHGYRSLVGYKSMGGLQRVGHDWATKRLSTAHRKDSYPSSCVQWLEQGRKTGTASSQLVMWSLWINDAVESNL